ncbi:MAG: hypothetical protein Ta2A_27290 [Treponemataceae bacterium]|nr:MAG: hypothetical protein Ta2A_27290 [Treponemataceae bacterium]
MLKLMLNIIFLFFFGFRTKQRAGKNDGVGIDENVYGFSFSYRNCGRP